MKIKVNAVLTQLNGEPLKNHRTGGDLMLREVSLEALLAVYNDEANLPPAEKVRRFTIAEKINAANGEADLSVEEVTEIRKVVGKLFGPLIVGQVYRLLD